jgi:hypothetical protein
MGGSIRVIINICKICSHPKRLEIDRKLVQGQTMASISKEYGMSEAAVLNHRDHHLSRQLKQAQDKKSLMASQSLYEEVDNILNKIQSLMKQAEDNGHIATAIMGVREWRSTLQFVTNLAIQLKELEMQEDQSEKPVEIRVTIDEDDYEISLQDFQYELRKLSKQELIVWNYLFSKVTGAQTHVERPDCLDVETIPCKTSNEIIEPEPEPEPEKEIEFRRNKYPRPSEVPDDVPILDKEIDEPDPEEEERDLQGLTRAERMRRRPRHETAY